MDFNISFERENGASEYTLYTWGTLFDEVVFYQISADGTQAALPFGFGNGIAPANDTISEENKVLAGGASATLFENNTKIKIVVSGSSETNTYELNLRNVSNTISQSHLVNVASSKFTWSDSSVYNSLEGYDTPAISRSVLVKYPSAAFKDDLTFTNKTKVNIAPIHVGTWNTIFTSTVRYTDSEYGVVSIIDKNIIAKESTVDANTDLCCFNKAITVVKDRYDNAKCKNSRLADRYLEDLNNISSLYSLIQSSIACNELGSIASYVDEAKKIAELGANCGCTTEDGSLVVDIFGNVASIIDGLDSNISIESSDSSISVSNTNTNWDLTISDGHIEGVIDSYGTITNLQSDVTTLQADLNTAETNITNLQTNVASNDSDITEINSTLSEHQQVINAVSYCDIKVGMSFQTPSDGPEFNNLSNYGVSYRDVNLNVTDVEVVPSVTSLYAALNVFLSFDAENQPSTGDLNFSLGIVNGSFTDYSVFRAHPKLMTAQSLGSTYYVLTVGFVFDYNTSSSIIAKEFFMEYFPSFFYGSNSIQLAIRASKNS